MIHFKKTSLTKTFLTAYLTTLFRLSVCILLPLWLGGCILAIQFTLLCLITTNTVLLLWWRKESEIKASGPILSIPIMIGCSLLCAASIVLAVKEIVLTHDVTLLMFLCNLEQWSLSIGIDLIFATLSLRLLRLFGPFVKRENSGQINTYFCTYF